MESSPAEDTESDTQDQGKGVVHRADLIGVEAAGRLPK
ncbi:MAG: hypothetical protein QOF13_593 [Solirubrobacterales bacterium]|jgi:hypothetical protein|nr:hypothetical protein [Solirubrobacterales bacterium]